MEVLLISTGGPEEPVLLKALKDDLDLSPALTPELGEEQMNAEASNGHCS